MSWLWILVWWHWIRISVTSVWFVFVFLGLRFGLTLNFLKISRFNQFVVLYIYVLFFLKFFLVCWLLFVLLNSMVSKRWVLEFWNSVSESGGIIWCSTVMAIWLPLLFLTKKTFFFFCSGCFPFIFNWGCAWWRNPRIHLNWEFGVNLCKSWESSFQVQETKSSL